MTIRFRCRCGRTLAAKDEAAGRKSRCPVCQAVVIVPLPQRDEGALQPPAPVGVDGTKRPSPRAVPQAAAFGAAGEPTVGAPVRRPERGGWSAYSQHWLNCTVVGCLYWLILLALGGCGVVGAVALAPVLTAGAVDFFLRTLDGQRPPVRHLFSRFSSFTPSLVVYYCVMGLVAYPVLLLGIALSEVSGEPDAALGAVGASVLAFLAYSWVVVILVAAFTQMACSERCRPLECVKGGMRTALAGGWRLWGLSVLFGLLQLLALALPVLGIGGLFYFLVASDRSAGSDRMLQVVLLNGLFLILLGVGFVLSASCWSLGWMVLVNRCNRLRRRHPQLTHEVAGKEMAVAYVLCVLAGPLGAHRFYLRKMRTGIAYALTSGLFLVGWIYDLCTLARQVREVNAKAVGGRSETREGSVHGGATDLPRPREDKDA